MKKINELQLNRFNGIELEKKCLIKTVLTALLCFLLAGCGGNTRKKTEIKSEIKPEPLPVLDISAKYPDKKYEGICELEYIPMETADNALIAGPSKLDYVSNERIIITNFLLGDVLVFDGKGKILYAFNHSGGGPKEYPDIRRTVYDEKNRELFIFTYGRFTAVYSEQGEYRRRWDYGKIRQYNEIFDYDDESLLANVESEKIDSAYVFVSKTDGEILSAVNLPSENAIATIIVDKERNTVMTWSIRQLMRDGDGFILFPISSDTVYRLTREKQLVPLFTRTPAVRDSDPPSIISPIFVTDRFILLMQYAMNNNFDAALLTYDREEKRFYGVCQWDCPDIAVFPYKVKYPDLPHNSYADLAGIHKIKDMIKNENEEVDDKLKALSENLDDDDNPVLEILRFK